MVALIIRFSDWRWPEYCLSGIKKLHRAGRRSSNYISEERVQVVVIEVNGAYREKIQMLGYCLCSTINYISYICCCVHSEVEGFSLESIVI